MPTEKRIGVDIDGVLAEEGPAWDRPLAPPLRDTIALVNRAFAAGHWVCLFTARGWQERRATEDWLARHGVRYSALVMGKPIFDLLLDDRATPDPARLEELLDAR